MTWILSSLFIILKTHSSQIYCFLMSLQCVWAVLLELPACIFALHSLPYINHSFKSQILVQTCLRWDKKMFFLKVKYKIHRMWVFASLNMWVSAMVKCCPQSPNSPKCRKIHSVGPMLMLESLLLGNFSSASLYFYCKCDILRVQLGSRYYLEKGKSAPAFIHDLILTSVR